MITKQSKLNQIEVTETGIIQARVALDLMDGDVIEARKWRRTSFVPGSDVDVMMGAFNAALSASGWPPISDYQAIKDHAAIAWTPEVMAAYQAQSEDA